MGERQPLRTHTESLKYLRQIDSETAKGKALHLIADDDPTHEHRGRAGAAAPASARQPARRSYLGANNARPGAPPRHPRDTLPPRATKSRRRSAPTAHASAPC